MTSDSRAAAVALPAPVTVPADRSKPDMRLLGLLALGHMVIDINGPPCQGACPGRGCLEVMASGSTIGREGELTSRSRECLLTLDRLLTFLAHAMSERGDEKALRSRVKTASRDVQSLADHIGYLSTKITFLLDATLGMINNE